jgi:hypothetical protein
MILWDGIAAEWSKLHNKTLCDLYCSDIVSVAGSRRIQLA